MYHFHEDKVNFRISDKKNFFTYFNFQKSSKFDDVVLNVLEVSFNHLII